MSIPRGPVAEVASRKVAIVSLGIDGCAMRPTSGTISLYVDSNYGRQLRCLHDLKRW